MRGHATSLLSLLAAVLPIATCNPVDAELQKRQGCSTTVTTVITATSKCGFTSIYTPTNTATSNAGTCTSTYYTTATPIPNPFYIQASGGSRDGYYGQALKDQANGASGLTFSTNLVQMASNFALEPDPARAGSNYPYALSIFPDYYQRELATTLSTRSARVIFNQTNINNYQVSCRVGYASQNCLLQCHSPDTDASFGVTSYNFICPEGNDYNWWLYVNPPAKGSSDPCVRFQPIIKASY